MKSDNETKKRKPKKQDPEYKRLKLTREQLEEMAKSAMEG